MLRNALIALTALVGLTVPAQAQRGTVHVYHAPRVIYHAPVYHTPYVYHAHPMYHVPYHAPVVCHHGIFTTTCHHY